MKRMHIWLAATAAGALVVTGLGAEAGGGKPPASQPAGGDETMQRLIGQMKENPLVEPSQRPGGHEDSPAGQTMRVGVDPGVIGAPPGGVMPKTRLEGEFIVNQPGRLAHGTDGSRRIFVFEGGPTSEPPIAVIPCRTLQSMEELADERGERLRFDVSGQVLLYHGVNYLLPTAAPADRGATTQPSPVPAGTSGTTAAPATPGTTASTGAPATQPSNPGDMMENLINKMKPNADLEPSAPPPPRREGPAFPSPRMDPGANLAGVAPQAAAPDRRREGEFIVARRGRVSRSADGLSRVFVFDADSEKAPEPPLILVPCTTLQSMEELAAERGDRIRFIVSGQVLEYHNTNYILPTMMKLAEDRGNLQN